MHPFGPGAFGQIFDDARRHAADDTERIDGLAAVEPERDRDTGGSAGRAKIAVG